MKIGKQTWQFISQPRVIATGTVVGEKEGQGPLGQTFDLVLADPYVGQKTWEKAEQKMMEMAQAKAVEKSGLSMENIDLVIAGDLLCQNISANFAARTAERPYLGLFSACATSMEAMALAAAIVDAGQADYVMAAVSSHHSTAERMFRFPTEYGAQKPPTAHSTVTGAGAAIVGHAPSGIRITHATIGTVTDLGVQSPWEMGAAMAPAAVRTIDQHFRDTGRQPADYDLIATGDLANVGLPIANELLLQKSWQMGGRFTDCGMLIYDTKQQVEVFSGGSGAACCAVVTFSHLLNGLSSGQWKRILVIATGALLSSVSAQQNETMPCIAHAVVFEADPI